MSTAIVTVTHRYTVTAAALLALGVSVGFAQTTPTPTAPAAPPAPAAAEAPPPSPFSVNAGVASSYIYRGLNQSRFKPALQIGADYAPSEGFYAGTWASSIKWLKDFGVSNGQVEWDFYGGYKKAFGDFTLDVGGLQYYYPGTTYSGATNPDTTELYVAGTYKVLTLKYSHVVSKAIFAIPNARGSSYVELNAAIPLIPDKLNLNLHAGRQTIKHSSIGSYTDGKIELAYDFGNGFGLSGGATFTNANENFYTPLGQKFTGKNTAYALLKYTHTF